MKMTLAYISSAVGGELSAAANPEREIIGFFTDSRKPEMEKLFLALRGERVDGNSFVPTLIQEGCAAITDRKENLSLTGDVIYVPDVRNALQLLAKHYREVELDSVPIVGITGSVGKTTTKDMVALALSGGKTVHKTLGNFNSQIGLPQTVLATNPSVDCAVVELGMSYKGEMERISRCAMPDISVITNIGYSHIENLGSREAIRDEKLKIAAFSAKGSKLILNGDEPLLRNIQIDDKQICYVSFDNNECDCFARDIIENESGIRFVASIFNKDVAVSLKVRGKHFVTNALFALATAYLLGIDITKASYMLSTYESDGKRQHIYESNGHTVISDCYNASPESMEAALSVLKTYNGRRIAVLGDMLELGHETENLHKLVGKYTNNCVDMLVTYGEHSKFINESSSVALKYHFEKEDRAELHNFLQQKIALGDIVLYKASNGMNLSALIV